MKGRHRRLGVTATAPVVAQGAGIWATSENTQNLKNNSFNLPDLSLPVL
jgi:hypothetical protein